MVGLVLAAVTVLFVVWVVRLARRRGDAAQVGGPPAAPEPWIADPADLADLEARFARIDAAEGAARDHKLACRLRPLVARRVPARVVEAVPALHAARIRFADGTCVLVRGTVPGNVALLASWVGRRSLVASSCSTDADGTTLVFGSPHARRTVAVVVTGLDQPD